MRHELVDHDGADRSRRENVRHAGIAAHGVACLPGAGIALAIARTCQHEGMTCAVRTGGKRRITAVVHLENNGVARIAKAQHTRAVLEAVRVGERAKDIREAVGGAEVGGVRRDHKEGFRLKNGIGRERVVNSTGDSPAAQLLEPGLGIIDLDELQIAAIEAVGRMIHDLRDDHAMPPGSRPELFARQGEITNINGPDRGGKAALGIREDGVRRRRTIPDIVHCHRIG